MTVSTEANDEQYELICGFWYCFICWGKQRHYRENWLEPGKDIYDIITACSSTHWSERKEGLMGLQAFLRSGNVISTHELRKLIEILGKMFTDSHTKVRQHIQSFLLVQFRMSLEASCILRDNEYF